MNIGFLSFKHLDEIFLESRIAAVPRLGIDRRSLQHCVSVFVTSLAGPLSYQASFMCVTSVLVTWPRRFRQSFNEAGGVRNCC